MEDDENNTTGNSSKNNVNIIINCISNNCFIGDKNGKNKSTAENAWGSARRAGRRSTKLTFVQNISNFSLQE